MPDTRVIDNTTLHRFELEEDGQIAFLLYGRMNVSIRLLHTEVPEALRGKGMASRLVSGVLRLAAEQKLNVIPMCPFVVDYVKNHPEYMPMIDPEHRQTIEDSK